MAMDRANNPARRPNLIGKAFNYVSSGLNSMKDTQISKNQTQRAYEAKGNESKPTFQSSNLSGEQPVRKNAW